MINHPFLNYRPARKLTQKGKPSLSVRSSGHQDCRSVRTSGACCVLVASNDAAVNHERQHINPLHRQEGQLADFW
jgi:hypothetical protein